MAGRPQQPDPLETRIGIISGWRCWIVKAGEALLRPIYKKGLIWKPRQALEAMCPDEEHVVPSEGCKCGLWAVCHPMLLSEVHWKEHRALTLVVGQVALWGHIIEHERGWRAQFAYPTHLYALTDDEWLAAALRERYAVPVAWGAEAQAIEKLLPPGLRTRRELASPAGPSEMPSVPFALAGVVEMVREQEATRLEQLREDLRREQCSLAEERKALDLERARRRVELERRGLELRQLRDAAKQERALFELERRALGTPTLGPRRPSRFHPPLVLQAQCRGLSIRQDDIAAAVGCTRSHVAHWFAGRNQSSRVLAAVERLIKERGPERRVALVRARLHELSWSQNELARRIKKSPGYVSRVLRGDLSSSVIWKRIEAALSLANLCPAGRRQLEGLRGPA